MTPEQEPGSEYYSWDDIIGYEDVKEEAKKILRNAKVILIQGESGVGKRLFARAIHNEVRRGKPSVVIHCPNIQPTLFESEIFGYMKGAFTDAKNDKAGRIEEAKDGTVFFDEVGKVSIDIQSKLLRVIEERKFSRLGGKIERRTEALFIFATNKELEKMVREGLFIEDLYWRIERFTLQIPPLRERKDLYEIVEKMWIRVNRKNGIYNVETLSSDELEVISKYSFLGNNRELEGIMEKVALEMKENPGLLRLEVIEKEIEKSKRKAERMMREEVKEWHSRRLFKEIKEGDGTLRGVLSIFGVEEREHKKFHDFLRHQGIKIKDLIRKKER